MRNRGIPAETVAERVNSSVKTIEKHYDKEDTVQEMLKRRRNDGSDLDIQSDSPDHE